MYYLCFCLNLHLFAGAMEQILAESEYMERLRQAHEQNRDETIRKAQESYAPIISCQMKKCLLHVNLPPESFFN